MSTFFTVLLIIIAVLVVAIIALSILGSRAQKKQEASQAQIDAVAQTVSMLILDKKRVRLKKAGFPATVVEHTPRFFRNSKVPVVKAKVGPKILTLMCDAKVFELLPLGKEVKVSVSGIYITAIKSIRGGSVGTLPKKKGLFSRFHH